MLTFYYFGPFQTANAINRRIHADFASSKYALIFISLGADSFALIFGQCPRISTYKERFLDTVLLDVLKVMPFG